MKSVVISFILFCIHSVVPTYESYGSIGVNNHNYADNYIDHDRLKLSHEDVPTSGCWMTFDTPKLFKVMNEIDVRYTTTRNAVQLSLQDVNFDDVMMKEFILQRGAALREIHAHGNRPSIPSGINLGGYCMLRMPESVLFFHRMKLRNNTFFRVDGLRNDLANMVLRLNLSLNDLHLKGAYERSLTDNDPSILVYAPTFGEVEFLLKDVKYKMEGRYRLIRNKLLIELVTSEIIADDVLMTYVSQALQKEAIRIRKENLGSFMTRLKTDLDKWLKDYFNDYLINVQMDGIKKIDELSKYDKEKETALEEFTDNAIKQMGIRIRQLKADAIKLPVFTFKTLNALQIKLYDGVLRGLDSMYRRSLATGIRQKSIRQVDAVVGFSNLKVVYKYEAVIPTGVPPLTGVMTLSANELSAHLALRMINDPQTIDLDIEFLDQMKPESLTVEGAANVMISNFKHLLEHQIVALMSNALLHGIKALRSLPSCEPFIPGQLPTKKTDAMPGASSLEEKNEGDEYIISDLTQEIVSSDRDVPDPAENTVSQNSKAALRSTKIPGMTPRMKQLNKNKISKLRNKKQNKELKKKKNEMKNKKREYL